MRTTRQVCAALCGDEARKRDWTRYFERENKYQLVLKGSYARYLKLGTGVGVRMKSLMTVGGVFCKLHVRHTWCIIPLFASQNMPNFCSPTFAANLVRFVRGRGGVGGKNLGPCYEYLLHVGANLRLGSVW